jgi:hypothetical protein
MTQRIRRPLYENLGIAAHVLSAVSGFLFGLATLFRVMAETGNVPSPDVQPMKPNFPEPGKTPKTYFDL